MPARDGDGRGTRSSGGSLAVGPCAPAIVIGRYPEVPRESRTWACELNGELPESRTWACEPNGEYWQVARELRTEPMYYAPMLLVNRPGQLPAMGLG